jgi:hypothetical protein
MVVPQALILGFTMPLLGAVRRFSSWARSTQR